MQYLGSFVWAQGMLKELGVVHYQPQLFSSSAHADDDVPSHSICLSLLCLTLAGGEYRMDHYQAFSSRYVSTSSVTAVFSRIDIRQELQ
jgi:hypothetical protein